MIAWQLLERKVTAWLEPLMVRTAVLVLQHNALLVSSACCTAVSNWSYFCLCVKMVCYRFAHFSVLLYFSLILARLYSLSLQLWVELICKSVITSPDPTHCNCTGQFSDHSSSGAVVTELASWVELSWVRSGNVITLKVNSAQLDKRSPFFCQFSTCSELHDWQQTGNFFIQLSWVELRVMTSPDSTQLKSFGQLSEHNTVHQLSWVESGQRSDHDLIIAYIKITCHTSSVN